MNKKYGFTLVEIMIVVLIIGLLAAIAVPNFVKARKSTQAKACVDNMRQIQGAIEQSMMEGETPSAVSDLCGADKYIKTEPFCPAQNQNDNPQSYNIDPEGEPQVSCPINATEHFLPVSSGGGQQGGGQQNP